MRVCLYSETALPVVGGQEVAIDAIARQFLSLGHDVVVLTLRPRRRQVVDDGHFPYPVVRHRRYWSTRYLLGAYRASLSLVHRKFPFDVLHCHNVYPAGHVAAEWTASRGIPLVITSHACDIATDSHLLKKPGVAARASRVLRRANALVAISDTVEERYRQLGADDRRITRIANGAEVEKLRVPIPRPAGVPDAILAGNYFLFLGRLVDRKGVDLLLAAFSVTVRRHDIAMVIAGTGGESDHLRLQAAQLGLTSRVHFLGDVAGDLKGYLLQNAISTVIPSRIAEGSSLVLWESFAAGRPIIGTAIPGLREAIQPGETGWLVPAESVEALATAFTEALTDRAATDQMGRTARRSMRHGDWRSIAEQHVTLYERCLPRDRVRVAA